MKWKVYYDWGINSNLECGSIDVSEGFPTGILKRRENQQDNHSERPLGAW
jgi:hypothetical protein